MKYIFTIIALISIISLSFCFPEFTSSGKVYVVEYFPSQIRHRSIIYYDLWGIKVYTADYSEWRSDMDSFIVDNGVVDPIENIDDWQLVKGFKPGVRGWFSNQKRYCKELGCWSNGDEIEKLIANYKQYPELGSKVIAQLYSAMRLKEGGTVEREMLKLFRQGNITSELHYQEHLKFWQQAS